MSSSQTNEKMKLVWSEEFDYEGKVNPKIWSYDTAGNAYGWGNNEQQFYTANKPSNAFVSNGTLKIVAQLDTLGDKKYTSARLVTKNNKDFKYGRIEIRAKLPKGKGIWPAIWMLGSNIDEKGWPLCGEIDIMEHVGYEPDSIYATIHSDKYNHLKNTQKMKSIFIEDPYDSFHVYTVDWSPERMDFYVDDVLYNSIIKEENSTIEEWPFDSEFYLLLNVAVGGNWGGKYGVDDSIFPATMEVDYVRLYQ